MKGTTFLLLVGRIFPATYNVCYRLSTSLSTTLKSVIAMAVLTDKSQIFHTCACTHTKTGTKSMKLNTTNMRGKVEGERAKD